MAGPNPRERRRQMGETAEISGKSMRYLRRLVELMRARASCEVTIELRDGGVKYFRESRLIAAADLEPPTVDGVLRLITDETD